MLIGRGPDDDQTSTAPTGLSRRAFLQGCSVVALAIPLAAALPGGAAAAPGLPGIDVRPRSAWAEGAGAPAPLPQEVPGDVRFLLVHHSASPNGYGPGDVPGVLRGFHRFHTGPEKGWPDVAYNFFVDRYGAVWEGRAGSLAGPVLPDATGGSQGFAQICCLVGDHSVEPPTPEAQASMVALLAALAERYGIDPGPGATASFVSRGSNKWPAGTPVTTSTIAGHRDMSLTTCPGDAAYPLVRDAFPAAAAALLAARAPQAPVEPSPPLPEPAPAEAAPAEAAPTTSAPAPSAAEARTAAGRDDGAEPGTVALVGAGVVAAGTAVALVQHARRRQAAAEGDPDEGRPA